MKAIRRLRIAFKSDRENDEKRTFLHRTLNRFRGQGAPIGRLAQRTIIKKRKSSDYRPSLSRSWTPAGTAAMSTAFCHGTWAICGSLKVGRGIPPCITSRCAFKFWLLAHGAWTMLRQERKNCFSSFIFVSQESMDFHYFLDF